MKTEKDKSQPWWSEMDVDGYWHIGVGDRGFADLGDGPDAKATAECIVIAHNDAIASRNLSANCQQE
jgi:hypothetical protein